MTSLNFTPQKQQADQRSKSCETACSSNSSCFFQKRKPINPLASPVRSGLSRNTANSVRQRVLSAKLLKLKSVQNQLNDANFHLAEVIRENQALKTLQKRQDRALTRYEGTNAELPRLIQSHEEEIRFLTEKNKLLRRNVKELNQQIKHKSDELQIIQEQLRHYEKLDKDKHLMEREKLIEELEDVRKKLKKADAEIIVLNRKLTLETKTSKQRLNLETAKHKQCQKELAQSLLEIGKLTKLLEAKEKSSAPNGRKRFSNLPQRQSTSLISLNSTNFNGDKMPVTEVKLEPLTQVKEDDCIVIKPYKSILKCPSESIRTRLSTDSRTDMEELPSVDKLSLSGSETSNEKIMPLSRPTSSQKLEKMEINLHNTIRKIEENKHGDDFSKRLGDFCLRALDSVKNYGHVIENHKESLGFAKEDTDKIIESMNETENVESKLHESATTLCVSNPKIADDCFDFVSQIQREEADFQEKYQEAIKIRKAREPTVGQKDKKKLLATLRAIDNGDSIDSFDIDTQKKNQQLMKELFGDIAD